MAQRGRNRPEWPSTVTVPDVTIWVPTMQRISVVLPHPDGPSSPVMVPRAIVTERVVQRGEFTADHPQILRLTAARRRSQ